MPTARNEKGLYPKKLTVNSAHDTLKETLSVQLEDVEKEVRERFPIGSTFRLEMDCRVSIVAGRARYKPGLYTVLGLYPHYVLAEREDLDAKEKRQLNDECNKQYDAYSTPIIYKSKESFTYGEMWQIMKGTYAAQFAYGMGKETE